MEIEESASHRLVDGGFMRRKLHPLPAGSAGLYRENINVDKLTYAGNIENLSGIGAEIPGQHTSSRGRTSATLL